MRVYRSIKDNKGPKKTGRGAQNYKYFEKIQEIVGDKPSNNPRSSTVLDIGVNNKDVFPAHDAIEEFLDSESDAVESISTVSKSESTTSTPNRSKLSSVAIKNTSKANDAESSSSTPKKN